jgi:hypothetical protein
VAGLARVGIVADDLIWSTRLAAAVRAAGGEAVGIRSPAELRTRLGVEGDLGSVIVDLTARSYEPVDAVALAHAADRSVLAVGPHDDTERRDRARAAGADRVLAYRAMFERGPEAIRAWLSGLPEDPSDLDSTTHEHEVPSR